MNAVSDASRICRACLCEDDKMISVDKPYNPNSQSADTHETIGGLMMSCADVQVRPYHSRKLTKFLKVPIFPDRAG